MKEILLAIQNKLNEVAVLQYIDDDWGQIKYYDSHPAVKFPFALIDFSQLSFDNLGVDRAATPANRQTATGTITITVGNLKLTNTSLNAPLSQKIKAWEVWEIIESVHGCLHGWKPTDLTGALIRTGQQRIIRSDGIQEYRITYTIGMTNV